MIIGLVLAGGASRRFGEDKALFEIDGQPMMAHVLQRLANGCDRLLIAGGANAEAYERFGLPVLSDMPEPGLGPLGGILAGLHAMGPSDRLVTSPCDTPYVPAEYVARMAREAGSAYAVAGGRWHFGHAIWSQDALPIVTDALQRGDLRLKSVLKTLSAAEVPFDDAEAFQNLNQRPD